MVSGLWAAASGIGLDSPPALTVPLDALRGLRGSMRERGVRDPTAFIAWLRRRGHTDATRPFRYFGAAVQEDAIAIFDPQQGLQLAMLRLVAEQRSTRAVDGSAGAGRAASTSNARHGNAPSQPATAPAAERETMGWSGAPPTQRPSLPDSPPDLLAGRRDQAARLYRAHAAALDTPLDRLTSPDLWDIDGPADAESDWGSGSESVHTAAHLGVLQLRQQLRAALAQTGPAAPHGGGPQLWPPHLGHLVAWLAQGENRGPLMREWALAGRPPQRLQSFFVAVDLLSLASARLCRLGSASHWRSDGPRLVQVRGDLRAECMLCGD